MAKYVSSGPLTDLTRLVDGRVMCTLCYVYVEPDQLADDLDVPGVKVDICLQCSRGLDLYHLVMSAL